MFAMHIPHNKCYEYVINFKQYVNYNIFDIY